jgi:hypothetical protein
MLTCKLTKTLAILDLHGHSVVCSTSVPSARYWIRGVPRRDSMEQNTQPSLSTFEEGTHYPNNGLDDAVSPADVGANIVTDESSSITAVPYRGFDDGGEVHATSSSTSEGTNVSGPFTGLAYRLRRIFSPRSTDMQQLLMKLQTQFEMLEVDQKKYYCMRNGPSKLLHLNTPPHTHAYPTEAYCVF